MDTDTPRLNLVLVEDHAMLRDLLKQALEEAGHCVTALSCAEEIEDLAGGQPADVFLIDVNLPGEDGFSLTARLHAAHPLAGLIVITARSGLQDKLEGYARGADLYLTKPIEVPEVCAAVAAVGRRRVRTRDLLEAHALFVLSQQELSLNKTGHPPIRLSASEVAILTTLARAPGQRAAYWQIAEVLNLDLKTYTKASLEVRIVRLRKKLIEAGAGLDCLESIRGHGYQLCLSVQVV